MPRFRTDRLLPAGRIAAGLVVLAVAAGGLATATPAAAAGSSANPITDRSTGRAGDAFANPSLANRPLYRFWNTGGLMTAESVEQQAEQIRASGAGGYEANQLTGAVEQAAGYDAATMGWGTQRWTDAWTSLFEAGKSEGLRVDGIYTPGWSAGTQTVDPDGVGSAKEISFGRQRVGVGATYSGALPTTSLPSGVTERVLQGLVAYRCVEHCETPAGEEAAVPVLDADTAVDLTDEVVDGRISWTAPGSPAGATYVLVAAWMHGTGQTVGLARTKDTTYLVDHFDRSGFQAVEDYWDDNVLTPELRAALKASGGSMFFDSLELNRDGEQVRSWTGDFLDEFQRRRGYSLVPYLAAVAVTDPVFDFTGDTGDRIREDYNQTLSDLFIDDHLKPLKAWAKDLGMTVRGQGYSSYGPSPIDQMDTAALLDIPEGEDLSFTSGFTQGPPKLINTRGSDVWRSLASVGAQTGKDVISTECCAALYNGSVQRQLTLAHVNQQFSVGVNQIVWHGWADQSPGAASAWPGFSPFGAYVSDVYGPQNPTFEDEKAINAYVGRMQTVLRRGELRNDVAIYRDDRGHSVSGSTGDLYFADQSLARAGYTYGFMNSGLINHPSSAVAHGRLDPAGLGYRAFVWDATANPETNATMDLADARRVLGWAEAGLPVVIVGDLPTRVRGHHPDQDAALRKVQAQLLDARSVTQVATEADVLAALTRSGVEPAVSYADAPVVSLHRRTSDTDYYYLFNSGDHTVSTTAEFAGSGDPYLYDAWTGDVTRMAAFARTSKGVRATVTLGSGDSTVVAVTRGNADTKAAGPGCAISATSSTAPEVVRSDRAPLAIRASEPGTYRTKLSNGKGVVQEIESVPAISAPASWSLDVTAWRAGSEGPNDTDKVALDRRTVTPASNGRLPDWQRIAGLETVSGTSVYTSRIVTGRSWSRDAGAYLGLGTINGLATVSVNGRRLPVIDQVHPDRIDIGPFLRKGANTVTVTVSTLIGNAAYGQSVAYGLVGPVTVQPYVDRVIGQGCGSAARSERAGGAR